MIPSILSFFMIALHDDIAHIEATRRLRIAFQLKPHGADIKESPGRAQAMRPDPPREATGRDLS